MLTIWGRATSSNVQIAMWAAKELKLDVKRIDVGGTFGGTDTPEYRSMNPNGLIPVLQDNGLTLFESGAILRYLGAKYGNDEFWPKDPTRRAELDKWAEWSKTTLCPVLIYHVFWTLVRTPKGDRDMNNLKTQVEKLGELMEMATAQIGDSGYIGGESLSFADIMFGHTLFRYFTLPFTRKELPDLSAYYERLQTHVAYREHVMVDYSSLQVE